LDLPVFIPQIEPNQSDPNLTNLHIGVRYGWTITGAAAAYSTMYEAPIVWRAEMQNIAKPPSTANNTPQHTPDSDYYWARSIKHVTQRCIQPSLNAAIQQLDAARLSSTAWASYTTAVANQVIAQAAVTSAGANVTPAQTTALNAANTAVTNAAAAIVTAGLFPPVNAQFASGSAVTSRRNPPQLGLNDRMSFTSPTGAAGGGPQTVNDFVDSLELSSVNSRPLPPTAGSVWIEIFVNDPLRALLAGFAYQRRTDVTSVIGVRGAQNAPPFTPGFEDFSLTWNATPTTSTNCVNRLRYLGAPEFDATDYWSPIDSLMFTSTMPLQPEIASATNQLGPTYTLAGNSSSSVVPTFTDISLPLDGGATDYLGKITYAPSAQYRWLEFVSNQPLTSFNFQLLWRSRLDDTIYKVYLKPSGSVQVKFMLQRKF
jgi:hypothetical protein